MNIQVFTAAGQRKVATLSYFSYVEKTANYAVASTDYTVNCTANSFTVTLPTAVGIMGQTFVIKNTGSGTTITVATTSSQTIFSNAASLSILLTTGDSVTLQSTGANWIVL